MKRGLTITLLVLLTVGLFVSCNADAIEKLFPEENPPAPETYTVTFDLNGVTGGAAPDTQTISSGEKATNPGDPTFDNHIFVGWYKTKDQITGELSDKWDFATGTVTENTTLYARWVASTIAGILSTVEGFPKDIIKNSTPIAPSDAWTNGAGVSAFTYKDIALILKNNDGYMYATLTTGVTFDATNNCYTATLTLGTLKFNMTDDVLTSFEYTGNTKHDYDGTYDTEYTNLSMKKGDTEYDWNKITITIKGTGIVSGKYYFNKSTVVDAAGNLKELVKLSGTDLTPEQISNVISAEGLSIVKEDLERETEYKTVLVVTNSAGYSKTIATVKDTGEVPPP